MWTGDLVKKPHGLGEPSAGPLLYFDVILNEDYTLNKTASNYFVFEFETAELSWDAGGDLKKLQLKLIFSHFPALAACLEAHSPQMESNENQEN